MKTRRLVLSFISVFAVIVLIGTCATTKQTISGEDFFEAFSGTWVNEEYSGGYDREQKIINYPDGTYEAYYRVYSKSKQCYGKLTITDKWTDSKGNIWYKSIEEHFFYKWTYYKYGKISNSGNTWEYIISIGDHPIEKWEPDFQHNYHIYYRQQ